MGLGDGTFGDTYAAEDLRSVYEAAMSHGLNLWDTATVYGMGMSEAILGELMKGTPRGDVIVSTKFTPQIEDGTPQAMENMARASMERMHIDAIDIYWIHNPMDVEKYTPMLIPWPRRGPSAASGSPTTAWPRSGGCRRSSPPRGSGSPRSRTTTAC